MAAELVPTRLAQWGSEAWARPRAMGRDGTSHPRYALWLRTGDETLVQIPWMTGSDWFKIPCYVNG